MSVNRFGATAAQVLPLYPGTALEDFGGQSAVEEAIDRAIDQILDRIPEELSEALSSPGPARIVARGSDGQTVASLPFGPVVAGSVTLWRGMPDVFRDYEPRTPEDATDLGAWPMEAADYGVTGLSIVLANPLAKYEQLWASWDVDQANSAYAVPALARLALRGAAADLGERVYSEAAQAWALVERYAKAFADDLDRLAKGEMVPNEVRALVLWEPVQPSGGAGGGVITCGYLPRG